MTPAILKQIEAADALASAVALVFLELAPGQPIGRHVQAELHPLVERFIAAKVEAGLQRSCCGGLGCPKCVAP